MTMTKPERRCPMCGVESKRIATSRHRPICSNLDCGLPVSLWKRVEAAMECARIVRALRQFEKRAYAKEVVGRNLDALARRALRGGKR